MPKAVAIPYIIMLILGVAVIGLVGFMLFSSGGKLGVETLSTECNGQKLIFCQGGGWKNECGTQPSQSDCNQFLGISYGAGSKVTNGPTFVHLDVTPPDITKR